MFGAAITTNVIPGVMKLTQDIVIVGHHGNSCACDALY